MSRRAGPPAASADQGRPPAELWDALVRCSVGALGLAMVATAPQVPTPAEFPALRAYAFVLGTVLVLVGASARHRPLLTILGCIALSAGLAASIVGEGQPAASRAALALDSGAAILLGAVIRRPWAAVPFLLVPVLIVAAGPPGWSLEQADFSDTWHERMGCECLWPGVPAALALVGAAVGDATARPWRPVRPSAFGPILGAVGLLAGGLVLLSVVPPDWAGVRLALRSVALVAGLLAWVALAYQAGRIALVAQAGTLGLLVLVGQLYADDSLRYPESFNVSLLATTLASLVPALLAGIGVLVRSWIGTEGPERTGPADLAGFFRGETAAQHVEARQPLRVGGFGPQDRPDEAVGPAGGSASSGGRGEAGRGDE